MSNPHAPYIIVSHSTKEGSTPIYDWHRKEEWTDQESVRFDDTITDDDMLNADLIVDVLNGRVRKNRFENVGDEMVIQHFFAKYETEIVESIKYFFKKYPTAWKSLVETAQKAAEELEKELAEKEESNTEENKATEQS